MAAVVSSPDDIFEVYVWSLVIRAGVAEGATIELLTRSGPATSPYLFRQGPGSIGSSKEYVFARFSFDGTDLLEVHQGIRVQGKSGVLHEADVSLIKFGECEGARSEGSHPRSSEVELAVECKFYGAPLGIGIGRGFMGLVREIGSNDSVWIATNASVARVSRLLTHHKHEWQGDLDPGAERETELYYLMRRTFKRFLATN